MDQWSALFKRITYACIFSVGWLKRNIRRIFCDRQKLLPVFLIHGITRKCLERRNESHHHSKSMGQRCRHHHSDSAATVVVAMEMEKARSVAQLRQKSRTKHWRPRQHRPRTVWWEAMTPTKSWPDLGWLLPAGRTCPAARCSLCQACLNAQCTD